MQEKYNIKLETDDSNLFKFLNADVLIILFPKISENPLFL